VGDHVGHAIEALIGSDFSQRFQRMPD